MKVRTEQCRSARLKQLEREVEAAVRAIAVPHVLFGDSWGEPTA
jgi:hypothetical protein